MWLWNNVCEDENSLKYQLVSVATKNYLQFFFRTKNSDARDFQHIFYTSKKKKNVSVFVSCVIFNRVEYSL